VTVETTTDAAVSFEEPLADLNAALARDALMLRIDPAYPDDKPIGLLLADSSLESPMVSQARLAVCLEAGATASFVEYHLSTGTLPHYANVHIDLDVASGAACRYVRLQERDPQHCQTARLAVRLERDARLEHFALDLGGDLTRNDLAIDIVGTQAEATLNGLYLAGPGQHVDNHTRTDHRVGPARSRQDYRGVLAGRCRAIWNGKAIVHRGADGTDAQQSNHNLLLSEQAEIDAKPELEIYADDVKCAHGTTVGQLDERALYYLRTRGIGTARARRILTRAFATTVVNTVPVAALRDLIGTKVEARLRAIDAGEAQ
jgi:Fe-S cluster assembly protein SufD